MADDADEVKVFRLKTECDDDLIDVDVSTSQLSQDKKDVVLEAELESRPPDLAPLLNGGGGGSFCGLSPNPHLAAAAALGGMGPFSPNYMNPLAQMMMMNRFQMPLSPSFNMWQQPMSPVHQLMLTGPGSPIYNAMMNMAAVNAVQKDHMQMPNPSAKTEIPLAPNLRVPNQHPLTQMNMMQWQYRPEAMTGMSAMQPDSQRRTGKMKKEDHIKKPLNAFMWFMKENRPKILNELGFKEKQSAELNKELGKRWHELRKEEQQKYFDMAKADREQHKEKYPMWSARENYSVLRRKKKKRDKASDGAEVKKCRARFGMERQMDWCKFCKRKKKCAYAYPRENKPAALDINDRVSVSASGSSGPSPLHSLSGGGSPNRPSSEDALGHESDSDTDADDIEDDEPTLVDEAFAATVL